MISVKKQGPFEVFSRGVEEPWAIWRDGRFFKQAWTWAEVEAILPDEAQKQTCTGCGGRGAVPVPTEEPGRFGRATHLSCALCGGEGTTTKRPAERTKRAHSTVKLGTTTHDVLSENRNGLTIRGPKGGVSHLVPTTNQPGVYAHNKLGKLAAAYYRREADGTFTKMR